MLAPLGPVVVPTPGTPVQAISQLSPVPPSPPHVSIHGVMFQVLATNTGVVYIGQKGMNKTTLAGVLAYLPIPTANSAPTFSIALTIAPNGLALEQFWIDAAVANEGCLVTYLVT